MLLQLSKTVNIFKINHYDFQYQPITRSNYHHHIDKLTTNQAQYDIHNNS